MPYQVLAVCCAVAGTDDGQYVAAVQVGLPPIVEHERGIHTFLQPGRVGLVQRCEHLDLMALGKLHLRLCASERLIPVEDGLQEAWGAVGQNVGDVFSVFVYVRGTAHFLIQLPGCLEVEVADACQRHGIE